LAIDIFSPRAIAKRRSLPSVPAYYSDILRWLPVMHDPQKYFSTHAVNEIRAFAEAARIMAADGITARFLRQNRLARAIRTGLAALGFGLFTEPEFLAPTLSVIRYPEGIDDASFRASYLSAGYAVAGGLGETAGRVFRMGHMGNLTDGQALGAVKAMGETVRAMSGKADVPAAVAAAAAVFQG
jgi:aspartate aminotransferase-like enzyme